MLTYAHTCTRTNTRMNIHKYTHTLLIIFSPPEATGVRVRLRDRARVYSTAIGMGGNRSYRHVDVGLSGH